MDDGSPFKDLLIHVWNCHPSYFDHIHNQLLAKFATKHEPNLIDESAIHECHPWMEEHHVICGQGPR